MGTGSYLSANNGSQTWSIVICDLSIELPTQVQ